MPALMPTDHYATIVWLGSVPANPENIRSEKQDSLDLTFEGIPGGQHAGHTRSSCVRVKSQHPEFTEIANVRQLSILSAEEVAEIAAECDLENLDPKYLGASVVIEGIDDFSHIPPSSRLQAENGTTLIVDMQNRPCTFVSREIEKDMPGHGKPFRPAAKGRRGVTAWIERPGSLCVGDRMRLHIPDQRPWKLHVD